MRTNQADLTSDIIDFGIGQPDFAVLPREFLRRAAEKRLGLDDTLALNYGYDQGDETFRLALARFLQPIYGCPTDPDQLMITAGASQALDLICTLFTQAGDTVFVEEPSYFLALRILQDHRLNLVSISTDDQGMVVDEVAYMLKQHKPKFIYTIPAFQNPTGRTLSRTRRQQLVALAQEDDFLIVADEVYHPLAYDSTPPPPLASQLDSQRVLSLGSFSKILAPGLRLGWIQSSPQLARQIADCGLADSGGGMNQFTSNLVKVMLAEGWQASYLTTLRTLYARRIQVMDQALRAHLGDRVRYQKPTGGYFFWLSLQSPTPTLDLLPQAHAAQVGFLPGVRCSSRGGLQNYLRLSFAFWPEEAIQDGIARLGRVMGG